MAKENKELLEALNALEKEKDISKEVLLDAIENSLMKACENHFGKCDNITIKMNRDTCDFKVIAAKTVVEVVTDPATEISLENAKNMSAKYDIGDVVNVDINSKEFGRIAAQNAKSVILQKIREEEKNSVYSQFSTKAEGIVTGIVQRVTPEKISVNLGKTDADLMAKEMVKGEYFRPTERIKLYVVEVINNTKGVKVKVSRSHPNLVRRLFESEVTEVKDGTVVIKGIAREAGSRTKMAVYSTNPSVDPVGACVGLNGARVNAIVNELRGEKIDIICWDENPAKLIENALSPSRVISVIADPDEKWARVIVPDNQLSLAIGKEGQNARLAARLTGFKIDIKSESQSGEFESDSESTNEFDGATEQE